LDRICTSRTSPLSVDGPPKVDHSAIDLQIDVIEMPSRVWFQPALLQVGRDPGSELVHPTPNRLIRHRHSAFRSKIFDVTQAQGESQIEPDRLVDDLGRKTMPRPPPRRIN
jgi:hypothetical protein